MMVDLLNFFGHFHVIHYYNFQINEKDFNNESPLSLLEKKKGNVRVKLY